MMIAAHKVGCTGKRSFLTFTDADKRATIMRRRWHEPLAAYRCKHCGMYHIGEPQR